MQLIDILDHLRASASMPHSFVELRNRILDLTNDRRRLWEMYMLARHYQSDHNDECEGPAREYNTLIRQLVSDSPLDTLLSAPERERRIVYRTVNSVTATLKVHWVPDEILGCLIQLSQKYPTKLRYGICSELGYYDDVYENTVITTLAREWELYSGNPAYPIPSPSRGLKPKQAYARLERWVGQYGELRQTFLRHMIRKIESDPGCIALTNCVFQHQVHTNVAEVYIPNLGALRPKIQELLTIAEHQCRSVESVMQDDESRWSDVDAAFRLIWKPFSNPTNWYRSIEAVEFDETPSHRRVQKAVRKWINLQTAVTV